MTVATVTGGTIAGAGALLIALLVAIGMVDYGARAGGLALAIVSVGLWWWGMAFTVSGDYHAWNVKEGIVERVGKRLIAADRGMAERYVVTINGQPYGVDDTRATLIEPGDRISLRCKKDYQWGVPRSAHGWACRWNGAA